LDDLIIPISSENQSLVLLQSQPLSQNPAAVYLASLESATGRRTMRQALNVIARLLSGGKADCLAISWKNVRYQHTAALRSKLLEQYRPATTNKMLSALRRVLQEAWRLGQMSAEDYERASDIRNVKGETLPRGRELSYGEIAVLMGSCEDDSTPAGIRDAALIAVLYGAGLRRAEVVALNYEDYDTETGRLIVRGKRNKERTAYLDNGAFDAVNDWILYRGNDTGPLFYPINKGRRLVRRRMTDQAVYAILQVRALKAGVKLFSPHDLRRTFVSDLLDAGADIVTVAKMAGHDQVQTTARYDRRGEEVKKKAFKLLHVPYRGKG
jgi:site-specific recombinase XerD